ncbi:hypothetical protein [Nocardiopsis sp. ATB16-24]|uniref:hypothetical protein n=1 Tax=Nocardiopsis sp. ATB16-24 TaxID=3019555 RepID=UPI002553C48B|nr:hypothetical protein [Nocardiopsis sp. ATB16-24]
MHQPPPLRFPSHTELYGRPFEVLAFCWVTAGSLVLVAMGARLLAFVVDDALWFGLDPVWAAAAEALAHTLGIVSLALSPVCVIVGTVLLATVRPVGPKLLPPWTTGERLRRARALIRDHALSGDPWTDLLARSYAGVRLYWGGRLTKCLPAACSLLCCLWIVPGVFAMARAVREQDPGALALQLYGILVLLCAILMSFVTRAQIRRMRDFCHLYDSTYRGMPR